MAATHPTNRNRWTKKEEMILLQNLAKHTKKGSAHKATSETVGRSKCGVVKHYQQNKERFDEILKQASKKVPDKIEKIMFNGTEEQEDQSASPNTIEQIDSLMQSRATEGRIKYPDGTEVIFKFE